MKTYLINPENKNFSEQDFDGQVNTLYTLFDSLLLEHAYGINQHIIYSDSNAYERGERPFFIGEQLFFGKVLVIGLEGFGEVDVKIGLKELKSLCSFKINAFYSSALRLLQESKVSFYAPFEGLSSEDMLINCEWVLYTFNMADEATQRYFLDALFKAQEENSDLLEQMKTMASLALKAANK